MNRRLHQKTIFFKIFTNPSWRKIGPENYHRSCVSIYTLYPSSCFSKKNSSYIFVVKTLPPPDPPEPLALLNHHHCTGIARKIQMSIDHFHPQSRALKQIPILIGFSVLLLKCCDFYSYFNYTRGEKMIIFIIFREIKNNTTARPVSPSYREQ